MLRVNLLTLKADSGHKNIPSLRLQHDKKLIMSRRCEQFARQCLIPYNKASPILPLKKCYIVSINFRFLHISFSPSTYSVQTYTFFLANSNQKGVISKALFKFSTSKERIKKWRCPVWSEPSDSAGVLECVLLEHSCEIYQRLQIFSL